MPDESLAKQKAQALLVLKELKRHGLYSHEFILRKYIRELECLASQWIGLRNDLDALSEKERLEDEKIQN